MAFLDDIPVNKFGENPSLATSFEDVWSVGGAWTPIATAGCVAGYSGRLERV